MPWARLTRSMSASSRQFPSYASIPFQGLCRVIVASKLWFFCRGKSWFFRRAKNVVLSRRRSRGVSQSLRHRYANSLLETPHTLTAANSAAGLRGGGLTGARGQEPQGSDPYLPGALTPDYGRTYCRASGDKCSVCHSERVRVAVFERMGHTL